MTKISITNQNSRTYFSNEFIPLEKRSEQQFYLNMKGHEVGPFTSNKDAEEARLFFIGIKPGLLLDLSLIKKELIIQYAFLILDHGEVLLSHSAEGMHVYSLALTRSGDSPLDDLVEKKLLGLLLGYPSIAISDFQIRFNNYFNPFTWGMVYYHGFQFICRSENFENCVEWLHKTYPIPQEYQTEIYAQLL